MSEYQINILRTALFVLFATTVLTTLLLAAVIEWCRLLSSRIKNLESQQRNIDA